MHWPSFPPRRFGSCRLPKFAVALAATLAALGAHADDSGLRDAGEKGRMNHCSTEPLHGTYGFAVRGTSVQASATYGFESATRWPPISMTARSTSS